MSSKLDQFQTSDQGGFRKGYMLINYLHTIRQVMESLWIQHTTVYGIRGLWRH